MHRETILVADDDPEVRRLVCAVLGAGGHSVLKAGNALEMMRFALGHPGTIDVLISDVRVAGLDGREVCRQLRRVHPETAFVILSEFADRVSEPDILVIPKPFAIAELLRSVRQALDRCVDA